MSIITKKMKRPSAIKSTKKQFTLSYFQTAFPRKQFFNTGKNCKDENLNNKKKKRKKIFSI